MSDEVRRRATANRMRKSRTLILKAAEELAESGELEKATMKDLALRATVSVNTVKRQFASVADVAYELTVELERNGVQLSDTSKRSLEKTATRSESHADREFAQRTLRELEQVESEVRSSAAIARLEGIYQRVASAQPDQYHLLAVASYYLSGRYLRGSKETATADAAQSAQHALKWAQIGTRHAESDKRSRHFSLRKGLAVQATEAARRSCSLICSALEHEPTELDLMKAKVAVVALLGVIASNKKEERDCAIKLNQPVAAAAAEFHRARAEALAQQSSADEIDAVLTMARSLDELARAGHDLPQEILVPFMSRLCATEVAYRVDISPQTSHELRHLRTALLKTLSGHQDAATQNRALTTMFALADRPAPRVDSDVRDLALPQDIHLSDLILFSGYGVIGMLLIADLLRDVARAKPANEGVYTPSRLLSNTRPEDLMAAAKMYYKQAPVNTMLFGAAAVLSDQARASLKESDLAAAGGTNPWPIFDSSGDPEDGKLDITLLNQLSLRIITGERPTPSQAMALLQEMRPLITTLEAISRIDMGPNETHVPTLGMRFS